MPHEINEATTQLYQELLASSAGSVEKIRSDSSEAGAKGDPLTLGAIALGLSVAAAPGIIQTVQNWLNRRLAVSVKIKLGDDEIEFPAPASATPAEIACDVIIP